jgi:uncharacterized protein (DUF58 family)
MTRLTVIPGKKLLAAVTAGVAATATALIAGAPAMPVAVSSAIGLLMLLTLACVDYVMSRRAWRASAVQMTRMLPPAFALGARRSVTLIFNIPGPYTWQAHVYDYVDPSFNTTGLPVPVLLPAGKRVEVTYEVTPTRRGAAQFSPAQLRVRSRWGWCEVLTRLGSDERRRTYPDFAQIARYAWLAGDRRLPEIGIKTYRQRGAGTDFKQLAEYRYGDPIRHIDWRATLRLSKPIIREFQDERDQCILLLIDCGRRMRADDRQGGVGSSHFDQVLNAIMLLSYVALHEGDAVGALTFGTPEAMRRSFSPAKGAHALNALMGELYDIQPTPTHSDYVAAASDLLQRHHKRALVILITNFRDEDSSELGLALQLLRSRHLVMLASLRERIIGELISQPLVGSMAIQEIASAQLYEQSRRDAFHRLANRGPLMVDAEPDRLGIELVNRYHAAKRSGLI